MDKTAFINNLKELGVDKLFFQDCLPIFREAVLKCLNAGLSNQDTVNLVVSFYWSGIFNDLYDLIQSIGVLRHKWADKEI